MAGKPSKSKKAAVKNSASKDSLKLQKLKSVLKQTVSPNDGKEKSKEVEKPKPSKKDPKDSKLVKTGKEQDKRAGKAESEAPKTPPVKRVRFKSPVAKDATSGEEGGPKDMRAELQNLAKLSNVMAELDGAGLGDFLTFIKDQNPDATAVEALVAAAKKQKGKVVDPKKEGDKLLKQAIEKATAKKKPEPVESDAEAEDADADGDEGSAEESAAEEEDGARDSDAAGEDEDEEDEDEQNEAEEEEEESSDADEEEQETPPAENGENALVQAVETTVANGKAARNSVTDKAAWDKFTRDAANRKVFPSKLCGEFTRNKNNLFNMWLDAGRDWTKTEILVERTHSQETLSRKQMVAKKAKDIIKEWGEKKGKELIQKRREAGLWYADEDYPTDPEDGVRVS